MSLNLLSARLQEAASDIALAGEIEERRPSAALLLYAQGAGQILQAAAEFHGTILERDGTLRAWAEQLRAAGYLPGYDRDLSTGLRMLSIHATEIRFPPAGCPENLGDKVAEAGPVTRDLLEEVRRGVEARDGPIKLALHDADCHAHLADQDLARPEPAMTAARHVQAYGRVIDAAVTAIWIKGHRTAGLGHRSLDTSDCWDKIRGSGILGDLPDSLDREMHAVQHFLFRAKRAERAPGLGDDDAEFCGRVRPRAAAVATLILAIAKGFLAEDIAPVTIPEPRPWGEVQAEEWKRARLAYEAQLRTEAEVASEP